MSTPEKPLLGSVLSRVKNCPGVVAIPVVITGKDGTLAYCSGSVLERSLGTSLFSGNSRNIMELSHHFPSITGDEFTGKSEDFNSQGKQKKKSSWGKDARSLELSHLFPRSSRETIKPPLKGTPAKQDTYVIQPKIKLLLPLRRFSVQT